MLDMLKECDKKSLTRVVSVFMLALFAFVTIYLLLSGKEWAHYDTLTYSTVPSTMAALLGNKYITVKNGTNPTQQNKNIERKERGNKHAGNN